MGLWWTHPLSSKLQVQIQGFTDSIRFYVFPMSGYDAILGRPWLYRHNPSINWRLQTVEIVSPSVTFLLTSSPDSPITSTRQDKQLLHIMGPRQVKNVDAIFLVNAEIVTESKAAPLPSAVKGVVAQYAEVFVNELPGLPPERTIQHEINTGTADPIAKSTYRMSPKELHELKVQLDELLKLGFIQPSSPPWASPVLFARKRDGDLRLCTDYRSLNAVTTKNKYPIPRVDEIFDSLGGAVIFSKIDLRSGYYQIRIKESDITKTAFKTHFGHFEYRVMPFGLSNAPATFMHLMNSVFHDILNKFVTIYLDDILIFSSSEADHAIHLQEVLKRLKDNKLYAKLSKCEFCVEQVEFLGHIISKNGLSVDHKKVQCIIELKRPTKLSELQSFLGLIGYYRKFIDNFSLAAAPLVNLTKKDTPFAWSIVEETAFECHG
jgi:hypothetical protein